MSKLETVIARLRALPEDEAEAIAYEVEAIIDSANFALSIDPDILAQVRRELEEPTEFATHDEVMAKLEAKYLKE